MSADTPEERLAEAREGILKLLRACISECSDPEFEDGGVEFMTELMGEINMGRARETVARIKRERELETELSPRLWEDDGGSILDADGPS